MKTVKIIAVFIFVAVLSLLTFGGALAQVVDDGDCSNNWYINFSLELRPRYWSTGNHDYVYELTDPDHDQVEFPVSFTVSDDAPLYDGQVMLRYDRLAVAPRPDTVTEISPAQDTVFQVSWVALDMSREEAQTFLDDAGLVAKLKWDGGEYIELSSGPLINGCAWEEDSFLFFRRWGPPVR